MPEQRNFTTQEASDLTGLSCATLQAYAAGGKSDLIRGEDFYIHRFAKFRKRLYFTRRGIQRLKLRAYRVYRCSQRPVPRSELGLAIPRRYMGSSLDEAVGRLTSTVSQVIIKYMRESPCAVPNCPCMTHRLGLPQADEIAAMLQAVKDAKAKRR